MINKTVEIFRKDVASGLKGMNVGIPGGLPKLDKKIKNIQKGKVYSYVASPKAGKTAFVLWRHIFVPWIQGVRNVKWVLYSLELDSSQILARLISMWFKAVKGIIINSNKVLGIGNELMSEDEQKMLEECMETFINPLCEKLAIITDKHESMPTAIHKAALSYASANGQFVTEEYSVDGEKRSRRVGYIPNNPDENVTLIIDTLGLMKRERGFNKKENIDKWLEDYCIELRNICKYTIINVHHLNRTISSTDRKKFSGMDLQPELDDIKDTSALGESSDMVLAIFNPNTYKHISEHLGHELCHYNGKYRSVHVLASRFTESFINVPLEYDGDTGIWRELDRIGDTIQF